MIFNFFIKYEQKQTSIIKIIDKIKKYIETNKVFNKSVKKLSLIKKLYLYQQIV